MADKYGVYVRSFLDNQPKEFGDNRYINKPVRNLFERVDFLDGDAIGTKGFFGHLPRHALIDPRSAIWFGAAGTDVTLNIGDANDDDALATLIDVSSAGTSPFLEQIAAANKLLPLWALLNYGSEAAAPELIDLYASIAGAEVVNNFSVVFAIGWTV